MPNQKKPRPVRLGSFAVINGSRTSQKRAVNKRQNHTAGAQTSSTPNSGNQGCPNVARGTHALPRFVDTKASETIHPRALVFLAVKLLAPSVLTDQTRAWFSHTVTILLICFLNLKCTEMGVIEAVNQYLRFLSRG